MRMSGFLKIRPRKTTRSSRRRSLRSRREQETFYLLEDNFDRTRPFLGLGKKASRESAPPAASVRPRLDRGADRSEDASPLEGLLITFDDEKFG